MQNQPPLVRFVNVMLRRATNLIETVLGCLTCCCQEFGWCLQDTFRCLQRLLPLFLHTLINTLSACASLCYTAFAGYSLYRRISYDSSQLPNNFNAFTLLQYAASIFSIIAGMVNSPLFLLGMGALYIRCDLYRSMRFIRGRIATLEIGTLLQLCCFLLLTLPAGPFKLIHNAINVFKDTQSEGQQRVAATLFLFNVITLIPHAMALAIKLISLIAHNLSKPNARCANNRFFSALAYPHRFLYFQNQRTGAPLPTTQAQRCCP